MDVEAEAPSSPVPSNRPPASHIHDEGVLPSVVERVPSKVQESSRPRAKATSSKTPWDVAAERGLTAKEVQETQRVEVTAPVSLSEAPENEVGKLPPKSQFKKAMPPPEVSV